MLERKTYAVLLYINSLTEDGGYRVLSAEDFLEALPKKVALSREALAEVISYLRERGFISVKYAADNEYCLTSLPKGRSFVQGKDEEERVGKRERKIRFWLPFFGAFLGGTLAAVLGLLLFYLLF